MTCRSCNGLVMWVGRPTNLTHTVCQACGAVNNQEPEETEEHEEEE